MNDILIIGAGLSGLTLAYNLKKEGINCKVLESQNRMGGRIQTVYGKANTPMEMGATWFGGVHQNLLKLLEELDLGYFKQKESGIAVFETMSFEPPHQYFVPESGSSSLRIKDGSYRIIEVLAEKIGIDNIQLETEITQIREEGEFIRLMDNNGQEYLCKLLIIAMPPRVFLGNVQITPKFPKVVWEVMQNVQTWMSGSVKFSVEYLSPFWTQKGYSGSVYSQSGLATEIYDHTNFEGSKFALKGFLNGSASSLTIEQRKIRVIQQLEHYYGQEATQFLSYQDNIWDGKFIKSKDDGFLLPHQNNGHPFLQQAHWGNKLFFAGAESGNQYGGYMDAAVGSANVVSTKISNFLL